MDLPDATNPKIMEVVKPIIPGLVAFLVATLLVNVYDSN